MNSQNLARKILGGQVVLEKTFSPFNGEIYVTEDILGQKRIAIGGLTQSGKIIEKIWNDGIKNLRMTPKNVLILGFGAGSAARVINRRYPKAKITGVEIDHKIIELARKYFDLPKIKNLKLVIDDAAVFVKETREKFDLIMVDLYQGDEIPRKCQTDKFFEDVHLLLDASGVAIFNHLYSDKEKIKAEYFQDKLRRVFPKVTTIQSVVNILFKAQK